MQRTSAVAEDLALERRPPSPQSDADSRRLSLVASALFALGMGSLIVIDHSSPSPVEAPGEPQAAPDPIPVATKQLPVALVPYHPDRPDSAYSDGLVPFSPSLPFGEPAPSGMAAETARGHARVGEKMVVNEDRKKLALAASRTGLFEYADRANDSLRWMRAEHSIHLTPAQFEVLAGDEAAYWCSELLLNDRGSWTAEQLAVELDMRLDAVQRGLRLLVKSGIARASAGRFRNRHPGKLYTFPGHLEGMQDRLDAMQGHWEHMFRRKGRSVAERVDLVRVEEGELRRVLPAMTQAVDGANACATHARGDDTGLYLVELRVRRMLAF